MSNNLVYFITELLFLEYTPRVTMEEVGVGWQRDDAAHVISRCIWRCPANLKACTPSYFPIQRCLERCR